MYYALIVVVIIGVVVYACLKKKRGNTEKPRGEEKPDDGGNHTEITVNVPTEIKGYIVKDGIKKEVTIRCMPQGLQVFDENGVCVMDITARLTRIIDTIHIEQEEFERTYHIPKGVEVWWSYAPPTDTKPKEESYAFSAHAPNVYIEYQDSSVVKLSVENAHIGSYLFVGVA